MERKFVDLIQDDDFAFHTFLLVGATGQGKSTFVNSLCGAKVAAEGDGNKPETEYISLHMSKIHQIIGIDTPGLSEIGRI